MARYYAVLEPDPQLAEAYVAMVQAIERWTIMGRPDRAAKVWQAYQEMVREYELLGRRGAAKADIFIRDRIRQSAVRPATTGRMASAVHSAPLPSIFPGGGVGIGDLAKLDALAVNPSAKGAGEYWRAQEYGTDRHVGRIVPGYFMPGRARPDAAQFRNHPYFEQAAKTRAGGRSAKGTPAMVITRPIRAKHFMRDGAAAFALWHEQQSTRINTRAISRLA